MSAVSSSFQICGNILSTKNYSFFALSCAKCENNFAQWSNFLKHLEEKHAQQNTGGEWAVEGEWSNKDGFSDGGDQLKTENEWEEGEEIVKSENDDTTAALELELEGKGRALEHLDDETDYTEQHSSNCVDTYPEARSKELKTFNFNLNHPELKAVSLHFLKLFEKQQLLWDNKHPDYREPHLRTKALLEMKLELEKIGYYVSDNTLPRVLRDYRKAQQELTLCDKVDKRTQYFLNKCAFLKGHIEHQAQKLEDKTDNQLITKENDNDSDNDSMEGTVSEKDSTGNAEISSSILYKNNLPYKRVRFNVPGNKIAIKLIDLLRDNPILWDKTRSDYNSPPERHQIIENWITLFKESYNVDFTYNDITVNLQALRRYYNSLPARKELHAAAQYVLEQCSFLPQRRELCKIQCEHCENFFLTQNNYKAHLYSVHSIGDSPYKCVECVKFFTTAHHRDVHIKMVHIRKYDFPCTQCERKFMRSYELQMHMGVHTGVKNFVCPTCGKMFRRRLNLNNHEIRVHLRQRNFPCHLCDKAFYTKALLKDHINAHLDVRNYKCSSCDKAFHSCHSLMRHKQIHAPVKKYACKLCEARFHQFVGLNAHMKKRHCFVNAMEDETTIVSMHADGDDDDDSGDGLKEEEEQMEMTADEQEEYVDEDEVVDEEFLLDFD